MLSFTGKVFTVFLKTVLAVLVPLNLIFLEFIVALLDLQLLYLAENFLRADEA